MDELSSLRACLNGMKKNYPGEWIIEPDYLEWRDEYSGYKCVIKRIGCFGHLCGYVLIPLNHPYYGKSLWNLDNLNIDVHGGLTLGEEDTDSDEWILGFDCAHSGDRLPWPYTRPNYDNDVYRNIEYVKNECTKLAKQLKDKERKNEP